LSRRHADGGYSTYRSAEEAARRKSGRACATTCSEGDRVSDPRYLTPGRGDGSLLGEVMFRGNVVLKG